MRSKDIWHYISLEMQAQGYVSCVAKSQCETKFKNFTRAYCMHTACIDRISKTGNDAKKCAYYEELHGIFHGDDNIKPPAVFSSRKELVKRGKEGTEKSTEREDEECTESDDHEDAIKKKKPRKKSPSERSESEVEKKEEKEEQKLQKLKELHNKKMTFLGQFLTVFEKSVQDK